jgi:hypothetical protein
MTCKCVNDFKCFKKGNLFNYSINRTAYSIPLFIIECKDKFGDNVAFTEGEFNYCFQTA